MRCIAKSCVVLMLITSVVGVFASPAVDLEPTALRALQAAILFFAALALAKASIASLLTFVFSVVFVPLKRAGYPISGVALLDFTCARLC
jgi:hypothetical protein